MRLIKRNIQKIKIILISFLLLFSQLAVPITALPTPVAATTEEKVTICHRTAATTNPYRKITVARSAVDGISNGDHYLEHTGPIFPATGTDGKWGDIIPDKDNSGAALPHSGLNWTTEGQEILRNDCGGDTSPTLTLEKTVVGGDASPSAWKLKAARFLRDAVINEAGTVVPGDATTARTKTVEVTANRDYYLSEYNGPDYYEAAEDWVCRTEGYGAFSYSSPLKPKVKISEGTDVTCTITNTYKPPKKPDLVAVKTNSVNSEVALGSNFDWTITVTNQGTSTATFDKKNILVDYLPGNATYSPTSNIPVVTGGGVTGSIDCDIWSSSGYTLDCDDNLGGTSVSIPVGGWFSVTFTVTPTKVGTLDNPRSGKACKVDPDGEVIELKEDNNDCSDKVVVSEPSSAINVLKLIDKDGSLATTDDQTPAQGWEFDVDGSPSDPDPVTTNDEGNSPEINVKPGTYSVTETVKDTYEVLSAVCKIGDTTVGVWDDDSVTGVALTNEDIANCIFINTLKVPPTLTLKKIVINDNGGSKDANDWRLKAQENGESAVINEKGLPHNGLVASTKTVEVEQGVAYVLSESGPSGYGASIWECTAGELVGNQLTLKRGEKAVCTITNDDKPTYITVNKIVENNYGGNDTEEDFQGLIDLSAVEWGKQVAVTPGWHYLSEAWWENLGYVGGTWDGDCRSSGWIYVSLGGDYECEITNYDKPAKVLLWKHVTNDDDGEAKPWDFTMQVGSETGTIGNIVKLNSNTPHEVYEDPGYEYEWTGTYCFDLLTFKQIDTPLVLDEGQLVKCIFYNDDIPRSTVNVHKYHDLNQNGEWDKGEPTLEPALEGWEFNLNCWNYDTLGVRSFDEIEKVPCENYGPETTDVEGEAIFENVLYGDYLLSEKLKEGWLAGDVDCSVDSEKLLNGIYTPYGSHHVYVPKDSEVDCYVGNYQDAELLIEKTNDQIGNVLSPGDTVNYTITVTNPDTSGIVFDATVSDLLPTGLDYVSGSWHAESTVRGDLTGTITPEPDYEFSDVGEWYLGDLAVDEVVTLTYSVAIADTVSSGVYDNVAFVAGEACEMTYLQDDVFNSRQEKFVNYEDDYEKDPCPGPYENMRVEVLGNLVDGEGDPFVKSAIRVSNTDEPEQGYVLGTLSVTGTPAVLSVALGSLIAVVGISLTRRKKFNLSKILQGLGRSSAMMMLGLLVGGFMMVGSALAASQLTVSQLASPTTQSTLTLAYQVATTDSSNAFVVTLDVDGPGSNDYVTNKTAVAGSHSGTFQLNMPLDGSYKVTVSTDNGTVPNVQTITRDATTPAQPNYSGVSRDGNTYTLSFVAPASDVTTVNVYASTSTSFNLDASTKVGEVAVAPGEETQFVYTAPDSTQRYFALTAQDVAGNQSSAVGDVNTVVTTVPADGSTDGASSSTGTDTNGTVSEDGATTDTGLEGVSDENGDESNDTGTIVAMSGIILFIVLAGAAYFVISSNRKPQE